MSTAATLAERVTREQAHGDPERSFVRTLIPEVQNVLKRFTDTSGRRLYVYLDDYYFVPRSDQVELLDTLHGFVRDVDAWLKIATIRHLTRWFDPSHQLGLQTGHDADTIDLDVTLQYPDRAKHFLELVLRNYANRAGISTIGRIFAPGALDRLVLASGAVPRDYLVLASEAIRRAQTRPNARLVGVQDVNKAAGDAAQVKVQELDEDITPETEWASKTRYALDQLLKFCLDDTKWTYLAVDHRERELNPEGYDLLASLMDLRMVHLLNPSVSDERRAGEKAEVYLLDLSQYSGERLKKFLSVLDLERGIFVQRETGRKSTKQVGDTPKKLIVILRRAPHLSLSRLVSGGTQGLF
jgi:hypothetical protein